MNCRLKIPFYPVSWVLVLLAQAKGVRATLVRYNGSGFEPVPVSQAPTAKFTEHQTPSSLFGKRAVRNNSMPNNNYRKETCHKSKDLSTTLWIIMA